MYFIELEHNGTRETSSEITWKSKCDVNRFVLAVC